MLRVFSEPVMASQLQPGDLFTEEPLEDEAAEVELSDGFACLIRLRTTTPFDPARGDYRVWRITIERDEQ